MLQVGRGEGAPVSPGQMVSLNFPTLLEVCRFVRVRSYGRSIEGPCSSAFGFFGQTTGASLWYPFATMPRQGTDPETNTCPLAGGPSFWPISVSKSIPKPIIM